MPHELLRQGMAYFFPQVEQRITRTLTMQPTATFASGRSGTGSIAPGKPVPYISFDAVVGRNSQFKDLSSDQLEELGGVEYRALKVLTWVVPCVSPRAPVPSGCAGLTCPAESCSVPALHPSRWMDHLLAVHRSRRSVQRRL